jgi:hypothetical protein
VTYRLQVDNNSNFSSPIIDEDNLAASAYTLASALADGTYYWRVKAVDGASNESGWCSAWSCNIDTIPPVVSGIATTDVTTTSVTITWTTSEPATSQVEYGTTTDYGLTCPLDSILVTSHHITLSGLDPDTEYHFRVISVDSSGNEATSDDYVCALAAEEAVGFNQGALIGSIIGGIAVIGLSAYFLLIRKRPGKAG